MVHARLVDCSKIAARYSMCGSWCRPRVSRSSGRLTDGGANSDMVEGGDVLNRYALQMQVARERATG
jgi:hypothetical protein